MASVSKRNVRGGTQATQGIDDRRRDTLVEEMYITGLDGTQDDLWDATNTAKSVAGTNHPSDAGLVPRSVRAWKDKTIQPGHARASVTYSRRRVDYIPDAGPDEIARIRGGTIGVKWCRDSVTAAGADAITNGRPDGRIAGITNETNREIRPTPYLLPTSIQRITVPTILDFDPYQYVEPLLNTTNQNTVTWLRTGYTFAANTLHFPNEGLNIDYIETADGIKYRVTYLFIFNPFEWQEQDYWFDETLATPAWNTKLVDQYTQSSNWVLDDTAPPITGFPIATA